MEMHNNDQLLQTKKVSAFGFFFFFFSQTASMTRHHSRANRSNTIKMKDLGDEII